MDYIFTQTQNINGKGVICEDDWNGSLEANTKCFFVFLIFILANVREIFVQVNKEKKEEVFCVVLGSISESLKLGIIHFALHTLLKKLLKCWEWRIK